MWGAVLLTRCVRWPAMVLVASGCGVELPAPQVNSIVPTWAYNGEQTQVLIRGEQFFPGVEVDVGRRGPPEVDDDFVVNLIGPEGADNQVSYPLVGVVLTDWTTLEAVVDVGLRPGAYDVEVVGPSGRRGLLEDGFFASDTRADRIGLDSALPLYTVNEVAQVDIALLDPAEQRVFQNLPVEVWAEREGVLLAPSHFDFGGWDDAVINDEGTLLTGTLGDDGFARVWLSVPDPGKITVYASPSSSRSGVRDGSLPLVWSTSENVRVKVLLPGSGFVTTAGEPFPVVLRLEDEFGNLVLDQSRLVLLWATCGALVAPVSLELRGERLVDVAVRRATGTSTGCPEERLLVANGGFVSEAFQVLPAELARIGVFAEDGPHEAGAEVTAAVQPTDAFGNAADFTGPYLLTDSVGGVLSYQCVSPFCRFVPSVAADGVELIVNTARGISGRSSPYLVVPGPPVRAALEVSRGVVRAGDPLDAVLRFWDAYDNPIPSANAEVSFMESELADADCAPFEGTTEDLWLRCTLTVAREEARVGGEVALEGHAFEVSGGPVQVLNGPLALVDVEVSAGSVVAGDEVDVSIFAFDAFGNPYAAHTNSALDVLDSAGSAAPVVAQVDSDGLATARLRFTASGATEVIVRQGGADLGRSSPIGVLAGPAVGLVLDAPPWVAVGVEAAVGVRVVDAFGNTAAVDGLAMIQAASGAMADVPVSVAGGRGLAPLAWAAPVVDERLEVALAGLVIGEAAVQVYASCAQGPSAALRFATGEDARSCFDAALGEAIIEADLGESAPGAAALVRYGLRVVGGAGVVGLSPNAQVQSVKIGRFDVEALVMDAGGCGAVAAGTAWVGPDDGSAVGRLEVSADAPTLGVGGAVTLRLAPALTCAGEPAVGAQVAVRTTRGRVVDGALSGAGISFNLDEAGTLAFTVRHDLPDGGGLAQVRVWASHLAASGGASVLFTGDGLRPQVIAQAPAGAWVEAVDTIDVQFSEPVDLLTASPSAFALSGSVSGPQLGAITDVEPVNDGRTLRLLLAAPLDASAEAWTLVISRSVSDLAGNGLDGRWSGVHSDYSSVFGAVPVETTDAPACLASPSRFRPDGDNGTGEDLDDVVFSFQGARQPARWVVRVLDASDAIVRVDRIAPLGAADVWLWDGRDQSGGVVANGAWRLEVRADDGFGNLSPACVSAVYVDNRGGL